MSCDVLLTPHPEASDLWTRLSKRTAGDDEALLDRTACREYALRARDGLHKRLDSERAR